MCNNSKDVVLKLRGRGFPLVPIRLTEEVDYINFPEATFKGPICNSTDNTGQKKTIVEALTDMCLEQHGIRLHVNEVSIASMLWNSRTNKGRIITRR